MTDHLELRPNLLPPHLVNKYLLSLPLLLARPQRPRSFLHTKLPCENERNLLILPICCLPRRSICPWQRAKLHIRRTRRGQVCSRLPRRAISKSPVALLYGRCKRGVVASAIKAALIHCLNNLHYRLQMQRVLSSPLKRPPPHFASLAFRWRGPKMQAHCAPTIQSVLQRARGS